MILPKIAFISKLRSFGEVEIGFPFDKLGEHTSVV